MRKVIEIFLPLSLIESMISHSLLFSASISLHDTVNRLRKEKQEGGGEMRRRIKDEKHQKLIAKRKKR
jgi:hypothetical protein